MKRTQRRHLKQNPVAIWMADATVRLQQRKRSLTAAAIVLVAALGSIGGYLLWTERANAQAAAALAEAMVVLEAPVVPPATPAEDGTPPAPADPGSYPSEQAKLEAAVTRLQAVADAHPSTDAGIAARYHAAAAMASLRRLDEAGQAYQAIVDRDPGGLYGQMARLGLAEVALRSGNAARAVELFEQASALPDAPVPLDAVLMHLGQAYLAAGQSAEAQKTFTRLVDEFPQSLYVEEARQELDRLVAGST